MATILIIDDEAAMRSVIRRALERTNHLAIEAGNGHEGLQALRQHAVDLVITDMIMPEMDGIEFILHLHRTQPALRIIATSGGGRLPPEGYLKLARAGGASIVLPKPFAVEDLLDAVEKELASREG